MLLLRLAYGIDPRTIYAYYCRDPAHEIVLQLPYLGTSLLQSAHETNLEMSYVTIQMSQTRQNPEA